MLFNGKENKESENGFSKNTVADDRTTATVPESCDSKSRLRQSHPECGVVFARSCFFARAFRGGGPKSGGDPERPVQRFVALFASHAAIDPCLFPWRIP